MNNKVKEICKSLNFISDNSRAIEELESTLEMTQENIKTAEKYMNRQYEVLRETMAGLETERNKKKDDILAKDIESILSHPLTHGVVVDKRTLNIFTKNIDIYDEDGNRYRGNNYRIAFDYGMYSVRFYGQDDDLCRKSYWTEKDPHPHVNGETGIACLGDAGSMISIAMNEHELYASYVIAINFLQQVNTDDPAGKYIRNWDCIDDEGNIIDNPHEGVVECSNCGRLINEDDEDEYYECPICGEIFCDECGCWIESEERYVCDSCLNEYYSYCDQCGTYVRSEDVVATLDECEIICEECIDSYPNLQYCIGCDHVINTDNDIYRELPNGDYMCENCFEESQYEVCSDCGDIIDKDEEDYIEIDGEYFCERCKDSHQKEDDEEEDTEEQQEEKKYLTFPCPICNERIEVNKAYFDENGRIICEDCYKKLYN